ncbi:hypothetical protein LNQ52_24535 [Klebsiella pneumoniae subsp. pneumoniae]|nr:hypothetical protein [Klebsiella pneumoniae subsp. pneumoniae]
MNGTVRQSPTIGIPRPLPLQCPVAAPYRAYTLPARSCRPGKRSAARHQLLRAGGDPFGSHRQ